MAAITLHQALEDVEVRFLYNLPESELSQIDRLFFQIEQAWWFYEDFHADAPQNSHLPHYKYLATFCRAIFEHCPLLAGISKDTAKSMMDNFNGYKHGIPAYGTIMLNKSMTKFVLCKLYGGGTWSFPRGKVNENENPFVCACRETQEETGFDPSSYCRGEEDSLVWIDNKKLCKLFIGTCIPEDTVFMPQTRKEVSEVAFHDISVVVLDKANPGYIKTWGVLPYFQNLKRWISQKQKGASASASASAGAGAGAGAASAKMTPKEKKARAAAASASTAAAAAAEAAASGKGKNKRGGDLKPSLSARGSRSKGASSAQELLDKLNTETFTLSPSSQKRKASNVLGSGSGSGRGRGDDFGIEADEKGWSVTDMFRTNERLMGRKLDKYDGSVHNFAATHPRYVNYSQRDGNTNGRVNGNGNSAAEALLPSATDVVFSYSEVFGLHVGDSSVHTSRNVPSSFPLVKEDEEDRPIGTDQSGLPIMLWTNTSPAKAKAKALPKPKASSVKAIESKGSANASARAVDVLSSTQKDTERSSTAATTFFEFDIKAIKRKLLY